MGDLGPRPSGMSAPPQRLLAVGTLQHHRFRRLWSDYLTDNILLGKRCAAPCCRPLPSGAYL
ncbi:hypothetical protein NOCARDAX2BIS_190018 [Nocardioides sp. AX2bis]|nr:hypothetical protein NOCARDAX2BIS_190018 [Nocardioides sp. AX2bis]